MKMIIKPMLFVFTLTLFLTSCNNEELFVEDLTEVVTPNDPDGTIPEDDATNPDASLPCDFDLNNLQPNQTVIINCIMDLGGATINVPSSVTIVYEGGDIINGTLNFLDNATISGELLNSTLTMGGAKPQIKDPVFNFNPKRWGIVEGETTSEIAQRNNNILESIMLQIKDLGISTFKIDKMDAYFEVSKVTSTTTNQNFYPQKEGINIPSDFNLIMTDNTILRVFPSVGKVAASLIGIDGVSNTTITGGVLYGDRDLRQYSKANAEEGTHLITIRSGKNIVLDGIKFTMGSIGGLNINSYGFAFNSDYDPTNNIIVKNCVFDKVRMMSLAITDGNNIVIENNQFLNTAQPTQFSDGGVVGYAINFEPIRERDPITNELKEYQKVHDVIIRNNIERGSRQGGFTVFIGQNITFDGNDMENNITYSFASDTKIINNTFKASDLSKNRPAITCGGSGETVFRNEVSGNYIYGYGTGISPNYRDIKIYNNTIENCTTAIQLKSAKNMSLYKNNIKSSISGSRGIMAHIADVDDVEIYENEISVATNSFYFVMLNKEAGQENYRINVFNNNITTTATSIFSNSNGVNYNNNTTKCGVQIANSNNISVATNNINNLIGDGISLTGVNLNIELKDNLISTDTKFNCIRIADTTNPLNVLLSNNTCD